MTMARLLKDSSGSASIEVAAFVPVIALFMLISYQFAMLFSDSVGKVGQAHAAAQSALRGWEAENAMSGFSRPCIEGMDETAYSSPMTHRRIGSGVMSVDIELSQEVAVVAEPICTP
jgi:Flp pilus assembly pilin Flp